jgi:hypothetical protein
MNVVLPRFILSFPSDRRKSQSRPGDRSFSTQQLLSRLGKKEGIWSTLHLSRWVN